MSLEQTPVTTIMSKNVEIQPFNQNLQEICKKMYEKKIGSIIIVENDLFDESGPIYFKRDHDNLLFNAGIITERDIVRFLGTGDVLKHSIASEIASKPLITINSNNSLRDSIEFMAMKKIKRLPVMGSENRIVGIVSFTDVIKFISQVINQSPILVTNEYPLYDESFVSKVNEIWSHDYIPF
ncbi:MAG: cyclic nucleotide-binding/CBS domain-containing protein [Nitrososphaeraceae archaeon]